MRVSHERVSEERGSKGGWVKQAVGEVWTSGHALVATCEAATWREDRGERDTCHLRFCFWFLFRVFIGVPL